MPALMQADPGFLFEHGHLASRETLTHAPRGCQTNDPSADDYEALVHFEINVSSRRGNGLRMYQPDELDIGEHDEPLLHHSLDHFRRPCDLLRCVHNRNHDGKILRDVQKMLAVRVSFGA